MFHVWRRSDGYVNASNGRKPLTERTDTKWSFEILLSTENWAEAEKLIKAEREASPHPLH